MRLVLRSGIVWVLAALAWTLFPMYARAVTSENLGVNFTGSPTNLSLASRAGTAVARTQVIQGSDTDAVVTLAAQAHLRLYPMLGIAQSKGVTIDAAVMSGFVYAFAQRYGPGGAFWTEHPDLPYLPVESYEIGNEPDIPPTQPADETHLHYADPADYAQVYASSRMMLHEADPAGQAVVGGMLDSGSVTLGDAERYLTALGPVDAIGFHPYLYDLSRMEQDTTFLRQWLDATGRKGVPLDLNEFGAPVSIANWGATVASYSWWALCTPSLTVEDVQPYWWGDTVFTDADPWSFMSSGSGALTSFGSAYLSEAQTLISRGCRPTRHKHRTTIGRRTGVAGAGTGLLTLR